MNIKQILPLLLALLLAGRAGAVGLDFVGNTREVYVETPDASTGLKAVYVLYDSQGVGLTFTASTDNPVAWYTFGETGPGFPEPIDNVVTSGRVTTLEQVIPNKGYIIEEGTSRTFFWVTDYSNYRLSIRAVVPQPADDCGTVTLQVDGQGDDIDFFTITGVRRVLDRQITLRYYTLEYNDTTFWQQTRVEESLSSFKQTIVHQAPLCNTTFTLSGDRFLEFWNEDIAVESDNYETKAVDVRAVAEQELRDNDNEKGNNDEESTTLGGSAPVNITFTGHCTDAVVHKEWQMATDAEFENIETRIAQEVVEQTFTEAGTFYWRFVGANDDGSCDAYSDVFTVDIGVSELYCPNVFSPGNDDGINDIWKVSYKSIIDFHCWIFNRWGIKVAEFTDPSQGWDGRYNGRLVKPGVYYYVVQAEGSDGQKYKLSGDINIIRFKKNESGDDSPDVDPVITPEQPDIKE